MTRTIYLDKAFLPNHILVLALVMHFFAQIKCILPHLELCHGRITKRQNDRVRNTSFYKYVGTES